MVQETLGKLIKEARQKRRWSHATLAGKLGVVSLTVIRWEKDESVPREEFRQPLRELLSLSEEVFLLAKKPRSTDKVAAATSSQSEPDLQETRPHEDEEKQQGPTDFIAVVKVYRGWGTRSDTGGEKHITVDGRPLPYVRFDRFGYVIAEAAGHLNWGYTGQGPRNLALSILADYFGETPLLGEARLDIPQARKYHYNFKMDFVGWFEHQGWEIWSGAITAWLKEQKEGGDPAPEHTLADIEHGWRGWSERWDKYKGT